MARVTADITTLTNLDHRHVRPLGIGGIADEMYLIRERTRFLGQEDRTLVLLYLDRGRSFGEAARLMGVCEATVARRVGRTIRRLMDGQYITCLRNRELLGRLGEAIAKDHLIDGFSIHAIAVRQGVSVYRVRKMLRTIRRLLREQAGTGCGNRQGATEGRN